MMPNIQIVPTGDTFEQWEGLRHKILSKYEITKRTPTNLKSWTSDGNEKGRLIGIKQNCFHSISKHKLEMQIVVKEALSEANNDKDKAMEIVFWI